MSGHDADGGHLKGKPAPNSWPATTRTLGAQPGRVFEDALPRVAAGHRGQSEVVVRIDRVDQARAPAGDGAGAVVEDLTELLDAR